MTLTASDLATRALLRLARLKYGYESLAEGAVRSSAHGHTVDEDVIAEAIATVRKALPKLNR